MLPIASLLITVIVSLLITRVAATALALTGLSTDAARFQARSAFTGVGFTTSEAETIVGHPVRRRIVMLLMLLGNAGLVAVVVALTVSFVGPGGDMSAAVRLLALAVGLLGLWLLVRSPWVDRLTRVAIERALRRFTDLDTHDYANLLHLGEGYRVIEAVARAGDSFTGQTVLELREATPPIVILGLKKASGPTLAIPRAGESVEPGDVAVLYGHHEALHSACSARPQG